MLSEFGLKPALLGLEVTESAIISSRSAAIAALTDLRALGVRLSIDDYGTGQSTLTYLKKLPVHELKIDQSFVSALCTSNADQIMVHLRSFRHSSPVRAARALRAWAIRR